MMGVKSKNLLMESSCPFCVKFLKEIDDLIDLLKKNDLDLAGFTSKIDELERKIDDMALSINEKTALKTKIQKAKSTGITDGDTFRSLLKQEFDNTDQFGVRQSSALDSADATKIDTVAVMKDPETAQLSFNSPNSKKELAEIELSFTKAETEIDYKKAFSTLDDVVNFYDNYFRELLIKKGYPKEFIDNYVSIWRNWVKNNETLKKWYSTPNELKKSPAEGGSGAPIQRTIVDADQVDDPYRQGPFFQKEYLRDSEPEIYDMYNGIIKKNGVDVTDGERKLLDDLEKWENGETVDFGSYRKSKDEVPDVVVDVVVDETADGLTEVIAETQAFDLVGLFNKSREEVDIEFLTSLEKMGYAIEVPIIKNAVDAIKKGKKLTSEEISLTKTYLEGARDPSGSRAFSDNEVAKIVNKLNNPTKGFTLVDAFYWRVIEPLFKKWLALDLKNYFKLIKGQLKTQDLVNEFQRSAERALRDFDVNNMEGSLREMRDKFIKIKSTNLGKNLGSYEDIYREWKRWMRLELKGNKKALDNFDAMCQKMETQKSNLFGSSWGELVGKVGKEERIDPKNVNFDVNQAASTMSKIAWRSLLGRARPYLIKLKEGLITNFVANTFRTPRDMERFLISKGYSRSYKNPLKDAAIVNLLQSLAMKFVALPTIIFLFLALAELIYNVFGGASDIDLSKAAHDIFFGSGGLDTGLQFGSEAFREALPEWYKYLSNNGYYENLPGLVKSIVFVPAWIVARNKLNSTEENLTNEVKEVKEKGWKEMVEDSEKNWNEKTEIEKLKIQASKSYLTIQKWLKETPPVNGTLTTEQAKIILDNLSFDGVPSIPTNRLIDFEVIGGTMENIKSGNFEIKKPKLETTGEMLVKGASGDKYLLVSTTKTDKHDRYGIYEKTDNPDIKGYYAVIKPKFNSLIDDTNWEYLSLRQFAQQYKNL
jgi:hypothetical protein